MVLFVLFIGASFLSYVSIYEPKLLSQNITPLEKRDVKKVAVIGAILGSYIWIWYSYAHLESSSLMILIQLVLIQVAVVDGYSKIIPNRLVLFLLVLSLVHVFCIKEFEWIFVSLFWAGLISIQLLSKVGLKKTVFGWGDVKLLLVLVVILQAEVLVVFILGIVLAGIFSMGFLIKSKNGLKQQIPLSPFFVSAALLLSRFCNNF